MLKSMTMTSDRKGKTEKGRPVSVGTTVTYLGHVPGGMVSVQFDDGTEDVMHPHCFKILRDK